MLQVVEALRRENEDLRRKISRLEAAQKEKKKEQNDAGDSGPGRDIDDQARLVEEKVKEEEDLDWIHECLHPPAGGATRSSARKWAA